MAIPSLSNCFHYCCLTNTETAAVTPREKVRNLWWASALLLLLHLLVSFCRSIPSEFLRSFLSVVRFEVVEVVSHLFLFPLFILLLFLCFFFNLWQPILWAIVMTTPHHLRATPPSPVSALAWPVTLWLQIHFVVQFQTTAITNSSNAVFFGFGEFGQFIVSAQTQLLGNEKATEATLIMLTSKLMPKATSTFILTSRPNLWGIQNMTTAIKLKLFHIGVRIKISEVYRLVCSA